MKHNKWIRRSLSLAMALCMLLACMPGAAFAEEAEALTEAGEYVIPEDAVYLSTAEDLLALAESCVSDSWSRDKVFVLENDIDLSAVEFPAIPSFGGTFLGQGHSITGLRLTAQKDALGFFRYLQKTALVADLHLTGTVRPSTGTNLSVGGIVGVNSGTVKNCSFTGTVSGTEQVGGIAGQNRVSGIVEGCTVSGTVFGDHSIGGIVGENLGVIRSCVNQALINTQVSQNSVSVGSLSLESLTTRESIRDAVNIGGIAGISSGVIRLCENRANVGYENMGYNVGGIAGAQMGYLAECTNYGQINGSDGVGGIVGQFKPNVVLNMGENYMQTMMDQMIGMMNSMSGMMSSMDGMMYGMSFDMDSMEDSMDMLMDPENLDPDSLNAALNEMSSSFNSMYQDMMASGSNLTGQMSTMMGSMGEMVETMEKLNEGLNIKIIDISREDTADDTVAKALLCTNHGAVHGENYVGGIAGIADMEDTTAQEDVQGQLSFSTEGEMVMRLVIRDCLNTGTVSATKQYAGGIVGSMTVGAVFGGKNTGSIDALNADYVGGIAGSSETYIVSSISRSILAGHQYVGGIAGFATEVAHCYAITDIAACTKYAGGILGYTNPLPDEEAGLILENRYLLAGENLGGIDGVCYQGATAPITLEEFLAVEDLDDRFRTVSIRFIAGDREDILSIELGKTLAVAYIPQLEAAEQEQYHWQLIPSVTADTLSMGETADVQYASRERLTNILFDQTYEAVFDAKNTVIASEDTSESGRPLALAVGTFDRSTTLNLTDITEQEPTVNGTAIREAWQVTMADIGIEKLHFLIPGDADPENTLLYVKDISGAWVQRDFTQEGSYMIFSFTHGESAFALEVLPEEALPLPAIAIAAALAALWILGRSLKKAQGRQKGICR